MPVPSPYSPEAAYITEPPAEKKRKFGSLSTNSDHFCLGRDWEWSLSQSSQWNRPKCMRKQCEQTKSYWTKHWPLIHSPSSHWWQGEGYVNLTMTDGLGFEGWYCISEQLFLTVTVQPVQRPSACVTAKVETSPTMHRYCSLATLSCFPFKTSVSGNKGKSQRRKCASNHFSSPWPTRQLAGQTRVSTVWYEQSDFRAEEHVWLASSVDWKQREKIRHRPVCYIRSPQYRRSTVAVSSTSGCTEVNTKWQQFLAELWKLC